jgi:uracil-DNA glycosylase
MPDASTSIDRRTALAAHLEFYRELGVTGISRDPAWRTRAAALPVAPPEPEPQAQAAVEAGDTASETPDAAARPEVEWAARADGGAAEMSPKVEPFGARKSEPEPFGEATIDIDAPPRPAEQLLAELRADIGEDCRRCKLCDLGRTQIVFGVGNPRAQLMFVGEAPGGDEDVQGEPFVGRAGQLLTKIIEAIGLSRSDVYIANVIKCRPPQNRNPEPDEVATCQPFLFRQIDAIKPRVIVALGTFAAQCLLKTSDPISRMRGRFFNYRGAQLMPTFHPAFLLRSPERKRDVWEDMKKVRALLHGEED